MNDTHDFDRRMADYYGAEASPYAPDWLLTRTLDVIDTTPQRRTGLSGARLGLPDVRLRRVSLALGSAVAVALVAAVAINFYADQPAVGPGGPPAPTPFAERFGDWTRSRLEPEPPHVHEIIAGGPGLVAVRAYSGSDDVADIWTSSDGRAWSRVPGEQLGPGAINDVTTGGPGLVAVGRGKGPVAADAIGSAVWTSRDGLTWSRAPDDPVFTNALIQAVSTGGPGLVAVGYHHRAWFSSDGLTWELASVPPVPPDVYPGDNGDKPQVYMTDVAAAGDRLVAIGSMMMNDNSNEAVVWTSADGTTWTDVPLDPDVFPRGIPISSVTGGPNGFIAIGENASGGPASMFDAWLHRLTVNACLDIARKRRDRFFEIELTPLHDARPADVLELVAATRSPPGTAYDYSSTNYVLLGLIIEQVRGRPLAGVLRDGVLRSGGGTEVAAALAAAARSD